jgi:hypothetical protein
VEGSSDGAARRTIRIRAQWTCALPIGLLYEWKRTLSQVSVREPPFPLCAPARRPVVTVEHQDPRGVPAAQPESTRGEAGTKDERIEATEIPPLNLRGGKVRRGRDCLEIWLTVAPARRARLPAGFAGCERSAARPTSATAASPFAAKPSAASGSESALAFGFGPGLIDGQWAPAEILAVEVSNCFRGRLVIGHFHKRKAARSTRVAVCHDPDLLNFSERTEQIPEFVLGGGKGKVTYKQVLHYSFSSQV